MMYLSSNLLLLSFFLLLNLLIIFFHEDISKIYNTYDIPDKVRKIHKKPIPLTGGLIVFINLFLSFFFQNFFTEERFFFNSEINIIFLISVLIFLLGSLDDKFYLRPGLKLFIKTLIILLFIILFPNIIISNIKFSFFEFGFNINYYYSLPLTILCFLLFINAFNMFDGIDLQSGSYSLIIILYFFFKGLITDYLFVIFLSIVVFLYFNKKNKSFMGDAGTYLLSFTFGYYFIKFYNSHLITSVDEVFILMLLPGVDMLRLFITRILAKKHPFSADRNHLHHLLLTKYGYLKTIFILNLFLLMCLSSIFYFKNYFYTILFFLFIYLLLYIACKKLNSFF